MTFESISDMFEGFFLKNKSNNMVILRRLIEKRVLGMVQTEKKLKFDRFSFILDYDCGCSWAFKETTATPNITWPYCFVFVYKENRKHLQTRQLLCNVAKT